MVIFSLKKINKNILTWEKKYYFFFTSKKPNMSQVKPFYIYLWLLGWSNSNPWSLMESKTLYLKKLLTKNKRNKIISIQTKLNVLTVMMMMRMRKMMMIMMTTRMMRRKKWESTIKIKIGYGYRTYPFRDFRPTMLLKIVDWLQKTKEMINALILMINL